MTNCKTFPLLPSEPVVHPGRILREEYMEPLGLTAVELASALHVNRGRIRDLAEEVRGITPNTALRLARYFGNAAEYWTDLQTAYDLQMAAWLLGDAINEITPRAGVGATDVPASNTDLSTL